MFDADQSGAISSDEVKEVLGIGKSIDDKLWKQIIKEVDLDGNGVIDFYEFKTMMQKMILENETTMGYKSKEDEKVDIEQGNY